MENHGNSMCRWLPLVLLMMTAIDYTVDTIEGRSLSKNKDRSLWLIPTIKSHAAVDIGHKMMEMGSTQASIRNPSGVGRVLLSLTKRHAKSNENEKSPSAKTSETVSLDGSSEAKKRSSPEVETTTSVKPTPSSTTQEKSQES